MDIYIRGGPPPVSIKVFLALDALESAIVEVIRVYTTVNGDLPEDTTMFWSFPIVVPD
jgi:hypothetical protein